MTGSMRTLSVKAAAAMSGLSTDRIYRAVQAGEIAHFREEPQYPATTTRTRGPKRHNTTTILILEESFRAWFFARVTGGADEAQRAARAGEAAIARARDVDDELLAEIPAGELRFS